MSLDDLAIRHALKPVEAELDRQKEKCAAMKAANAQLLKDNSTLQAEREQLNDATAAALDAFADATRELNSRLAETAAERDALEHKRAAAEEWRVAAETTCTGALAERDALAKRVEELEAKVRTPTREELEYTRAMALLGQQYGDPLGDDLSDHVHALLAEAATATERLKTLDAMLDRELGPVLRDTAERQREDTISMCARVVHHQLGEASLEAMCSTARAAPLVVTTPASTEADKNSRAYRNGMEDGAFAQREYDIKALRACGIVDDTDLWRIVDHLSVRPLVTAPAKGERKHAEGCNWQRRGDAYPCSCGADPGAEPTPPSISVDVCKCSGAYRCMACQIVGGSR